MLAAGSNIDWLETISRSFRQASRVTTLHRHARRPMASCLFLHRLGWEPPLGLWSTKHLCRAHPRHHPSPHGESSRRGNCASWADLVEAVRADAVANVDLVRVDGGMSQSAFFVQTLADFTGLTVSVAPHRRHHRWGGPAGSRWNMRCRPLSTLQKCGTLRS